MNKYFVYVFLRADRYTPYYVGKGTRKRDYDRHGRPCGRPDDKSRIVRVKEGLTEAEAFGLERTLIKFWGRKYNGTGILHNISEGGDGPSGIIQTEEQKKWRGKQISIAYKKKTPDNWKREVIYRIECSTQRTPVVYEGVEYRSKNEAARALMKKYGVSRNTCIRYIDAGRALTDLKQTNNIYKGTYTGTKYC